MYRKWLEICKTNALRQPNKQLPTEDGLLRLQQEYYKDQLALIETKNIIYDPINATYHKYNPSIDTEHDYMKNPNSPFIDWIGFHPTKGEKGCQSIKPLHDDTQPTNKPTTNSNTYSLQILNPTTLQSKPATQLLSTFCIRRFTNSNLTNIKTIHFTDGEDFNKQCIHHIDEGCNAILLTENHTTTPIDETINPSYPIIFIENETPTSILITPIQLLQINGISNDCETWEDAIQCIISRTATILGAVLINNNKQNNLTPTTNISNWFADGLCNHSKSCFAHQSIPHNTRYPFTDGRIINIDLRQTNNHIASSIAWCQHGWCSNGTHRLLKQAITTYKPKTILELGTWYGTSTRFILKEMPANGTLYTADYFKNVCIDNTATQSTPTPEDKMFMNFLCYESIVSSVEKCKTRASNFVTMKMDITEAVEILHQNGIQIDMVFIDAEKKTKPLITLINKIHDYFPSAVIVGDDNVFPSVKEAVRQLRQQGAEIHELHEAYMVLPNHTTQLIQTTFPRYEYEYVYNQIRNATKYGNIEKLRETMTGEIFKFEYNGDGNGLLRTSDDPYNAVSKMYMLCHEYVKMKKEGNMNAGRVFEVVREKIEEDGEQEMYVTASMQTPYDLLTYGVNFE